MDQAIRVPLTVIPALASDGRGPFGEDVIGVGIDLTHSFISQTKMKKVNRLASF